jgi:hypothetical protein
LPREFHDQKVIPHRCRLEAAVVIDLNGAGIVGQNLEADHLQSPSFECQLKQAPSDLTSEPTTPMARFSDQQAAELGVAGRPINPVKRRLAEWAKSRLDLLGDEDEVVVAITVISEPSNVIFP